MRCEVVAIGTELLLGQIIDSNSSWIGEQLALAGIDCHFQVKVGDNAERIAFCLRQALDRADAVICCGGLGPTQDDITRDVIADVMGVALHRDETIVDKIREMFEARGREMTDNNKRQADVPEGASVIAEMPGTAPGLVCPIGDKVIYAVPGVPYEMHEMMEGTILPDLRRRSGETAVIRSRILKTWGMSESGLAETLEPHLDKLDETGHATIAFQASGIEGLKVRLTVKAADEDAADAVLSAEEALVREVLGDIIFAVDDETMESVVLETLRRRAETLALHESLTGGLMATRMTAVDPEHAVFAGSLTEAPEGHVAVQEDAITMANEARTTFDATYGLAAVTPSNHRDFAPGTVFAAIATSSGGHAATVALPGDRRRLRNYAVISALEFLRKSLSRDA